MDTFKIKLNSKSKCFSCKNEIDNLKVESHDQDIEDGSIICHSIYTCSLCKTVISVGNSFYV